jgi:hypothetical protein
VTGVLTAISYDDAVVAEQELERKRKLRQDLELSMKQISLTFEGLGAEKDKLVSPWTRTATSNVLTTVFRESS